jgi:hypothetical protein
MKNSIGPLGLLGALLTGGAALSAQPNLQQLLKDTEVGAHWIYDDYAQAVAQAKQTGRPLLIVFR